jgi:hypothetical protein
MTEQELLAEYDYAVEKYKHFATMKKQYLNKEITSRRIVGTGYKNPKQVTLDYLNGQLTDWDVEMRKAYEALPEHLKDKGDSNE